MERDLRITRQNIALLTENYTQNIVTTQQLLSLAVKVALYIPYTNKPYIIIVQKETSKIKKDMLFKKTKLSLNSLEQVLQI
jgi:hypothetical protein